MFKDCFRKRNAMLDDEMKSRCALAYRANWHYEAYQTPDTMTCLIFLVFILFFNSRGKSAPHFITNQRFPSHGLNVSIAKRWPVVLFPAPRSFHMLHLWTGEYFFLLCLKRRISWERFSPFLRRWFRFLCFSRGRRFPPPKKILLEGILCFSHSARSIIISESR